MPKVLKRFQDKYTKKIHEAKTVYNHKDEARIDELVKAGFLDSSEEKAPKKKTKASKKV